MTDYYFIDHKFHFEEVRNVSIFADGSSLYCFRRLCSLEICYTGILYLHSLLGKPFTLECNQKTSASMYSMTVDMTVGLAEMVEYVFDRKGAPASLLGVPIDKTVPDYCEVSTSLRLFCYLHRILKELLTRQDSCGLLAQL